MVFQFGLNQHLFSKLSPLFVFSISVVKLKVSYIIRHVIIKHALVEELLILQVQNDDIKP
jgi:hypothetical protein